jgi:hypothetical protein
VLVCKVFRLFFGEIVAQKDEAGLKKEIWGCSGGAGLRPPSKSGPSLWWEAATGEARDMEPQGPGVRAAGGLAELQGIWGAVHPPRKAAGDKLRRTAGGSHFFLRGLR